MPYVRATQICRKICEIYLFLSATGNKFSDGLLIYWIYYNILCSWRSRSTAAHPVRLQFGAASCIKMDYNPQRHLIIRCQSLQCLLATLPVVSACFDNQTVNYKAHWHPVWLKSTTPRTKTELSSHPAFHFFRTVCVRSRTCACACACVPPGGLMMHRPHHIITHTHSYWPPRTVPSQSDYFQELLSLTRIWQEAALNLFPVQLANWSNKYLSLCRDLMS